MLNIIVERKRKSWDFKANPSKPDGFDNNYKNNMIDSLCLYDDNAEIARFKCQSVANYCFGEMAKSMKNPAGDSIAEGYFEVECFVEPRNFHGEIHGIVRTKDIDGQWINHESMQIDDNGYQSGRWLIHSNYSNKTKSDTNYAWSAGCIILSTSDLKAFNNLLHAYNVEKGQIIKGELVEEEVKNDKIC